MHLKILGLVVSVVILIVVVKIYRKQEKICRILDSLADQSGEDHQKFLDLLQQHGFKLDPVVHSSSSAAGGKVDDGAGNPEPTQNLKEHFWRGRRWWWRRPWRSRWAWYNKPFFYTDYPYGYYVY